VLIMEDLPRGPAVTSAVAAQPTLAAVALAAVIVTLTAFIVLSAVLVGTFPRHHAAPAA
jgi:hypothetical protein